MTTRSVLSAAAGALLALAAQAHAQLTVSRAGVPDTSPFRPLELPTPNGYRTGSGMPGPQYWQQKADYDIRASLDTGTNTVRGEETIRYSNNSPDTLRYVWLQLDQNVSGPNSRMAELVPPGRQQEPGFQAGYTLERVNVLRAARQGAKPAPAPLTYRINNTMMRVELDRPLAPRSVVSFDIAWHHQVPKQGRTGRERFPEGWLYEVAQWFPRLAVYDDVRGWNTEQYFGSGEFYLEYGDVDFAVTAPAGYTVTGTGVLANAAQVLAARQRTRLAAAVKSDTTIHVISPDEVGSAALLPPGTGATRTWRFHAANVRDVAWAAAPNFLWDASGWDGILIQALYPPAALPLWSEAADMGRHTIMHHSSWYHYPYPTAINVNGPVGGMEYPMIVFCSEREHRLDLYFVTTHELGHEWFPMIVGSNERLYGWQDEGFNTFIDYFSTADRFKGDTAFARQMQTPQWGMELGQMPFWTDFVQHYAGREAPSLEPQDRNDGRISGELHYTKPAVGLHFLRNEVVDSAAFDQAFREYARRWAFRHPTPADFFRTMNDALGEDLSWFWRSWFYRTDHLDQAIDSVTVRDTAGVALDARVWLSSRLEMVAPVDLTITGADGSERHVKLPVEVWYRGGTMSFPIRTSAAARPVRVVIDARGVYPDVNRGNNTWQAAETP
jgi:peptidase M1-like protein